MPPKRKQARRSTTAGRRKPAARKHPASRVKVPRTGPLHAQIGARMVLFAVSKLDTHGDTVRSRQDAAILRATHEGCPKCHGNGQIFTKGKDGSFTGSKPCPAPATKQRVSKWTVYKASRFGADKNTGLVGWACPCGKKEKPRYRDAKEATKALRTHERNKHGGRSVGGSWYAQANEGTATPPTEQKPGAKPTVTQGSRQPRPRPQTPAKDTSPQKPAKDKDMPNYGDPATPLTASKYAWSVTLLRRPEGYGLQPSHDCTGSYSPPPGATVGTFLDGVKGWYARENGISVDDVMLVRYELREK